MEECKRIVVYDWDCSGFKQWIRNIASKELNEKSVHELLEKIRKEILNLVNKAIHAASGKNSVQHSIECKSIGRGATSVCYENISSKECKQIFKEFSPRGFICESICMQDISLKCRIEFQWIADGLTQEQELRFLKRFIRFVLQSDEIDFAKSKSNEKFRNLFVAPKLVLSSIGFIYQSESFFGETLGTVFKHHNYNKINEVSEKIELVKRAAKYVQDICHDNCIYHGDIKPSNFFAVANLEHSKLSDIDLIQNIDFDTWVHSTDSANSVLADWDITATTPLYYYSDIERVKPNQTFETLQTYDVRALSRMLMYAILCVFNKEDDLYKAFENDKAGFDWVDYFFIQSGCGELLLAELAKKKENKAFISALYIFDSIKSLILGCTTKVKRSNRVCDIKTFGKKIKEIERLLKLYSQDYSIEINVNGIRYLGLMRLDMERGNKSLHNAKYSDLIAQGLSCDWVQYVIEQNYYKQKDSRGGDEQSLDLIDRHLIPDIKWGNGEMEKVQYDFEHNLSPLEQMLDHERFGNKSLFLTAEGGQGKTTSLRSFWLDFLSGKHNMPCLYVDLKMLNGNNGSEAINKLIGNNEIGYNISLLDAKNKPLLLLDGANEVDKRLRSKQNEANCDLISECRKLIKCGFRLVIGSRSVTVATLNNFANNKNEFNIDEMKFLHICELSDNQIQTCLSSYKIFHQKHFGHLLRNNMMLHIIMYLDKYNIKVNDVSGGLLLDYYFNVCFKTRYLKHICSLYNIDDMRVYELIKGKIKLNEDYEIIGDIKEKIRNFNKILKFLINNSYKESISTKELFKSVDKMNIHILCELSILKEEDDHTYKWANEIYQEYFEACYIKEMLLLMNKGTLNNGNIRKILDAHQKILDEHNYDAHNYNVTNYALQFAGEILKKKVDFYDKIIYNLNHIDKEARSSFVGELGASINFGAKIYDVILKISVLGGCGFPHGITEINGIDEDSPFDVAPFCGCSNLRELFIPEWVTRIGAGAFGFCSQLEKIVVDKHNPNYYSVDNCLIEIKSHTLIAGCRNGITPDNSINRVGSYAFSGRDMQFINIPNNIIYIDNCAFEGCEYLKKVIIPEGVLTIGRGAFSRCKSLESISLPSTVYRIGGERTRLDSWLIPKDYDIVPVFIDDCENLTTITVAPNNPIYHSAGNCLIETSGKKIIAGCRSSIIPDDGSVTAIGYCAFYFCGYLELEIPNKITLIENSAFLNRDIQYNKFDDAEYLGNEKNPFYVLIEASEHTKRIHENTVVIANQAFRGNNELSSIIIPRGVKYIGARAFSCCNHLVIRCETKHKPSGWDEDWLNSDGDFTIHSFPHRNTTCPVIWDCLNNSADEDGNEYYRLDGIDYKIHPNYAVIWWVYDEAGRDVIINEKVRYKDRFYDLLGIAPYAFAECNNINSVTIPASIKYIGFDALGKYSHIVIYCECKERPEGWDINWCCGPEGTVWDCAVNDKDELGFCYIDIDGCYYKIKDDAAILYKSTDMAGRNVVIHEFVRYNGINYAVKKICSHAFDKTVESITIPNSVIEIDCNTFGWLPELRSVTFGAGICNVDIRFVGFDYNGLFGGCDNLECINISRKVFSILKEHIIYADETTDIGKKIKVEFIV